MSKIPILCYHNVARRPAGTEFGILYVEPALFERQLWAMRRLGMRGVAMGEGVEGLGGRGGSGVVVMTFDDGYVDTLTEAAPLLARYGFRATCYLVSGCIGAHNRWDDGQPVGRKPVMSRAQIEAWLGQGMEIAS